MSHAHLWHYSHNVWEGRDDNPDEVGVVRYCDCGVKQIAYASEWGRLPRQHDGHTVIRAEREA